MENLLLQFLKQVKTTKTCNTYNVYKNALQNWFPNKIINFDLDYLTDTLDMWTCSQNTKVLRCRVLNKFMKYYSCFHKIENEYLIKEILQSTTPKEVVPQVVSFEQYQRIRNYCVWDFDLAISIALMYQNGLRISEVLNICTKNYDYATGTIIIFNTKNGNDYKILLTEQLNEEIYKYCDFDSEYLIHDENNHQVKEDNFRQKIKRLCKRAGYPELHCHSFRHGSAVYMLDNNIDLFTIKEHLRHKSLQSTQRYLHIGDKQRKQVQTLFANC